MPFAGVGVVAVFFSFCPVLSGFRLLSDILERKTDDMSFKQDLWNCHLKGTRKVVVTSSAVSQCWSQFHHV